MKTLLLLFQNWLILLRIQKCEKLAKNVEIYFVGLELHTKDGLQPHFLLSLTNSKDSKHNGPKNCLIAKVAKPCLSKNRDFPFEFVFLKISRTGDHREIKAEKEGVVLLNEKRFLTYKNTRAPFWNVRAKGVNGHRAKQHNTTIQQCLWKAIRRKEKELNAWWKLKSLRESCYTYRDLRGRRAVPRAKRVWRPS